MSKIKPGFVWDALGRRWKPVDYMNMSSDEMQRRRDEAEDRLLEVDFQVRAILPAAAAQALLTKGSEALMDTLIKLAKKAPEALLGVI
jgi:hypothetical protein